MWMRADLKMRAKQAVHRNYWSAVVVALVMTVITAIFSSSGANSVRGDHSFFGDSYFSRFSLLYAAFASIIAIVSVAMIVLDVFVGNVLLVGGHRFFILNQTETPTAGTLAYGFKSGSYGNVVLVMFMRDLFTFLWALLFLVPGIIKYYEYRMVPYILAENPAMSKEEAFLISKKMMMGQKWNTFVLDLSFIGWIFLSACTWGLVGIFYSEPYRQATLAELYAANRTIAYQNGYIR
ncbi:DUF975 family protein [Faecalicatena sp. AGMB00832]|uniref:DUF975 family protein n=1 Tax=Faecalicatena faecalis TaxID=2726362 RepID=A0ABS6D7X4_9FIRM|nr:MULTISPECIES: DUF975 family protein [Faecalicatena]MBU3877698.1 DUF975 family protein [Faecalicatena faecalis]MCI6466201.1 DUF975 family protein [Faecalicatena sp.]MDY5619367.1 DUF975 family protein [Lachnospiraceae bacterium]